MLDFGCFRIPEKEKLGKISVISPERSQEKLRRISEGRISGKSREDLSGRSLESPGKISQEDLRKVPGRS
mgnify:CR=1 FL=1